MLTLDLWRVNDAFLFPGCFLKEPSGIKFSGIDETRDLASRELQNLGVWGFRLVGFM